MVWSLLPTISISSDQPIYYLVNLILNEEYDDREKRKRKSTSDDADELRAIAEALPDLFGAINESIPKLITGLIGSIYSPEAAGNMGAAVGKFYRELIDQGIPEDAALDMTKKFVGALDFSKIMSLVSSEIDTERSSKRRKKSDDYDEEFDDE